MATSADGPDKEAGMESSFLFPLRHVSFNCLLLLLGHLSFPINSLTHMELIAFGRRWNEMFSFGSSRERMV